ncbi:MAG TPA: nucleotidyltransferase family protein [Vicinamibacterales bacterium]|nr:nucleotidyltransferase family protein [Vicinamibacterales bacterium]
MDRVLDLLSTVLRGDAPRASAWDAVDRTELLTIADEQGVLPLVADRLSTASWTPPALRAALTPRLASAAALDAVQEVDLARLLGAMAAQHVDALLFKGAALAYTHYRQPHLRPRLDTDLLVPPDGREAARRVLHAEGYQLVAQVEGDLVMYQETYVRRPSGRPAHVVDLHWRLANPQRFGQVFTYTDLARRAAPIAALYPAARAPRAVDALLLACVHRVIHHAASERLIWLFDIHLVAASLSTAEWRDLEARAVERGIAPFCLSGLRLAAARFRTRVPESVLGRLSAAARASGRGEAARLVGPPRRHVTQVVADLRALPGWSARCRLMSQHLFPSARYMRGTYAPASRLPLAVLYVRRAWHGARRWLVRP